MMSQICKAMSSSLQLLSTEHCIASCSCGTRRNLLSVIDCFWYLYGYFDLVIIKSWGSVPSDSGFQSLWEQQDSDGKPKGLEQNAPSTIYSWECSNCWCDCFSLGTAGVPLIPLSLLTAQSACVSNPLALACTVAYLSVTLLTNIMLVSTCFCPWYILS